MDSKNTEYEAARQELYSLLQEGLDDVAAGRPLPWREARDEFYKQYNITESERQHSHSSV